MLLLGDCRHKIIKRHEDIALALEFNSVSLCMSLVLSRAKEILGLKVIIFVTCTSETIIIVTTNLPCNLLKQTHVVTSINQVLKNN